MQSVQLLLFVLHVHHVAVQGVKEAEQELQDAKSAQEAATNVGERCQARRGFGQEHANNCQGYFPDDDARLANRPC
jgi:hypothetical protein